MEEEDLMSRDPVAPENDIQTWDPSNEQGAETDAVVQHRTVADRFKMHAGSVLQSVVHGQTQKVNRTTRKVVDLVTRQAHEVVDPADDVEIFKMADGELAKGFVSTIIPTMEERKLAAHNLIDGPLKRDEVEGHVIDIADAVEDATSDGRKLGVSKEEALNGLAPDVAEVLDRKAAEKVKSEARSPLPFVGADKGVHDGIDFMENMDTSPEDVAVDPKEALEEKEQPTYHSRRKGGKHHPWL